MNNEENKKVRDVLNVLEREQTIDKAIISSGKMTQKLIGNWLLWGIPWGLLFTFVLSFFNNIIPSLIVKAILTIVINGVVAFLVWKSSTSSSFNRSTIIYDDIPKVMKNLIIFTVIICVLTGIYNFFKINSNIDKEINSNIQLSFSESFINRYSTDKQKAEYNRQKEEAISKAKTQVYIYLALIEVGITAVHLAVLPLEKKEIEKRIKLWFT